MISQLIGNVSCIFDDEIIIDVSGVGYSVIVESQSRQYLSNMIDQKVKLFIHSITKEDGVTLYGFIDRNNKKWFFELIKISGISGKIAISILSYLSIEDISHSLQNKDDKIFKAIPGIGSKLATRIVNELKDITGTIELSGNINIASMQNNKMISEAIDALVNLGISKSNAKAAVLEAKKDFSNSPSLELEDLIKESIKKTR